ncbi:type I methionyl aminopeptidase [Candidatus Phytoplasma phoenicium]|uniref:Methionine aminopeptidase n=1 Tax=Candidatus Phytoplasma phoenicium TaxID=198422 RepID=A0A0L0MKF4_9MOLU|nr:type I methionyl aminopeptidase [Candidatus Phytoplasma phoenicium]KND62771.1 Methionine aminopeptidase [Candidatus Phytoplasma phoenicium]
MISIKSSNEIAIMKKAGSILFWLHQQLSSCLKVGISTWDLDMMAAALMKQRNVISAFKGYKGFGGHICISVNETVVHGLPSKKQILKIGDIVSIDAGIKYKGYYVDSAVTYTLGSVSFLVQQLLKDTKEALWAGIKKVKPSNHISDISRAIAQIGQKNNYGIIEVFSGHGIGLKLHEQPYIFNFDFVLKDYILKPGMVFCIEPMFTLGSKDIKILPDGWTAQTLDASLSAHFEHTILVTSSGYDVLTYETFKDCQIG